MWLVRRIRSFAVFVRDLIVYSIVNRVVWLVPLVLMLVALAGAVIVSQAAAPFIYTIF